MKENCEFVDNKRDLDETLRAKDRIIALFYASWCPFCRRFLPIFQQRAEKKELPFVAVQDDRETLADQYSVKIYPTVLFIENGVIARRLDGVSGLGLDEKQLAEFVNSCPSS